MKFATEISLLSYFYLIFSHKSDNLCANIAYPQAFQQARLGITLVETETH